MKRSSSICMCIEPISVGLQFQFVCPVRFLWEPSSWFVQSIFVTSREARTVNLNLDLVTCKCPILQGRLRREASQCIVCSESMQSRTPRSWWKRKESPREGAVYTKFVTPAGSMIEGVIYCRVCRKFQRDFDFDDVSDEARAKRINIVRDHEMVKSRENGKMKIKGKMGKSRKMGVCTGNGRIKGLTNRCIASLGAKGKGGRSRFQTGWKSRWIHLLE